MNPRGRGVDDELVNLGLILVAAAAALAAVLWLAGALAAFVTGNPLPAGGIAAGFGVLTHAGAPGAALGVPGLSVWVYWPTVALLVAVVVALAVGGWRLVSGSRQKTARDPHRLAGVATVRDMAATVSEKALLKRAGSLRFGPADEPHCGN